MILRKKRARKPKRGKGKGKDNVKGGPSEGVEGAVSQPTFSNPDSEGELPAVCRKRSRPSRMPTPPLNEVGPEDSGDSNKTNGSSASDDILNSDLFSKLKRMQGMVPPRTFKYIIQLCQPNDDLYATWEEVYCIMGSVPSHYKWLPNVRKPTFESKAEIPVSCAGLDELCRGIPHMSTGCEWEETIPMPVISVDLVRRVLARVHPFTTVGLETQAKGFCCSKDGVFKFLALFPQSNHSNRVTLIKYSGAEHTPDENDAFQMFDAMELEKRQYSYGCCIRITPAREAFLLPRDIFQLSLDQRQRYGVFSIIIAPKTAGIKVLAVRMTQDGTREVSEYLQEYERSEELKRLYPSARDYVVKRIATSKSKFYCPIPFVLSQEPCKLVDFRKKDEITSPLAATFAKGKFDLNWL